MPGPRCTTGSSPGRAGGKFVLRIEDTDRERSHPEWTDGILSSLEWLGITWDEGPYLQSERRELYEETARRLYETGYAYACECVREQIDERTKDNPIPGYDGYCRERALTPGPGRVLRFRVPDEGVTVVHDAVRGDVEFANSTIEDFVLVKSNGDPLFVLAVVADDMDMGITHVIRAEEHLPTTPKAVLVWEALGGPPLPCLCAPAGARERETPEAVETTRSRRRRGLPGPGLPARGDAELPRAPRLGTSRPARDPHRRRR